MRLSFRQRFFSWLDSYDVYDEAGNAVYSVEGKLSLGHRLEIYDQLHSHVGTVKEELLTFLPRFALYMGSERIGEIKKEMTFLKPRYTVDVNGWDVKGDFLGWDYEVTDRSRHHVMSVSKELFHMTDTYVLDIAANENPLLCLMVVLAIDAANCSQN